MHLAKYRFNHALGQTLEYMFTVFPPKAVTGPNEVGDGLPDMKLRVCFVPRQGKNLISHAKPRTSRILGASPRRQPPKKR